MIPPWKAISTEKGTAAALWRQAMVNHIAWLAKSFAIGKSTGVPTAKEICIDPKKNMNIFVTFAETIREIATAIKEN